MKRDKWDDLARNDFGGTVEDYAQSLRAAFNAGKIEAYKKMVDASVKLCPYCKGTPLYGCACRVMGSIAASFAVACAAPVQGSSSTEKGD